LWSRFEATRISPTGELRKIRISIGSGTDAVAEWKHLVGDTAGAGVVLPRKQKDNVEEGGT